ncbi:LysR family transcriptional regulator, partial [Mesorhizobium sp. M7A.F.Ca.US.001.04.2.1]
SIAGRHLPGRTDELVVARRRDRPHGPIANRLWDHIQQEAPALRRVLEAPKSAEEVSGQPASEKRDG